MRGPLIVGLLLFGGLWAVSREPQYAPANVVFMILGGSCPAGYEETPALNGFMVRGTVAANGNVGTTGGSDTFTPTGTLAAVTAGTPAGTNSASTTTATGTIATPTLAWPAAVPTFTGSALATHTHTTTATGTVSALTTGADSSTTGGVAKAIAQTPSFTGNSVTSSAVSGGTPAGTVAWPVGVPTSAALTFTGSSSAVGAQTFTGSALGTHTHVFTGASATVRPAFTHVIFCHKSAS